MLRILFFSIVLFFCNAATADAKCSWGRYSWKIGSVVDVHVKTDGSECHFNYHAGNTSYFKDLIVEQKPKLGSIDVISVTELTYTPKPHADGHDKAVIKVCFSDYTGDGCATINYLFDIADY